MQLDPLERKHMTSRSILSAAAALALLTTFGVAADQAIQGGPAGQTPQPAGRGFGGAPGGGPEIGMNTRPPNGTGQTPAFEAQTRAPEQKLNVAFDVATV